jgi:DNA-binding response OmpR family regulator
MTRVLVIDDEAPILRALKINLTARKYEVCTAADGASGLAAMARERPDVLILDLGLPDMDGTEVIKGVRGWTSTPIIVLSAWGQESQKVAALDAGADDYVTKPFGVNELIARMRAILRRAARGVTMVPETLTIGEASVNLTSQTVNARGCDHTLSFYEVELLRMLAERGGQPVARDEILLKIWGLEASSTNRTVDNFIVKLRKKIEKSPDRPQHILTVYGFGYRLAN